MSHLLMDYLIDTHCHLNLDDYQNNREEVISRATESGVLKMVIVGTSAKESRRVLEMSKKYKELYPTVGYHPFYLKNLSEKEIQDEIIELEELIKLDEVVAIGEIGLDYYYENTDINQQKNVFRQMLGLAKKYDKPVIVHSRDSFDDAVSILSEFGNEWRGVMHCFTGGPKVAKKVLDLGLNIGYTGLITYTKDRALLDSVGVVPLDKILVETDAPWLAPTPLRGEMNEPKNVLYVAKKLAELKSVSFEEIRSHTTVNAEKLLSLY